VKRLASRIPAPVRHAVRRVLRRPPSNARRYLRQGISVDEFLGRLTGAGVRYVVLRWFETLPVVRTDNDIDVLVADEDLPIVESMLTPYRPSTLTQKVDLYSVSGRGRTHFGGVPYFPEGLATRLLNQAVTLHNGRYKVPSPRDHLDSLAFHAVHHKGEASGLPNVAAAADTAHAGRIGATLERLSRELSVDLDLSLDSLDRYLDEAGLSPGPADRAAFAAQRRRLYGS
jgi:hypothetical protein